MFRSLTVFSQKKFKFCVQAYSPPSMPYCLDPFTIKPLLLSDHGVAASRNPPAGRPRVAPPPRIHRPPDRPIPRCRAHNDVIPDPAFPPSRSCVCRFHPRCRSSSLGKKTFARLPPPPRKINLATASGRLDYPDAPACFSIRAWSTLPLSIVSFLFPIRLRSHSHFSHEIPGQLLATPVHSPAATLTVLLRPTPVALILPSSFSAAVSCATARPPCPSSLLPRPALRRRSATHGVCF
jgi:hypothetical protein